MPRKYIRKTDRVNIDEKNMKLAVRECLSKRLNISEAARQYGIKRTTLQSRIKTLLKKKPLNQIVNDDSGNESEEEDKYKSKYSAKQVFTQQQESQLSVYIKKSSDLHYGLSYKQIRSMAYEFAKSLSIDRCPDNWKINKTAGKEWLISFMQRHPDLSLRKPESTSLSRSMAFNMPVVNEFFDKYVSVLEKYKFNANQIWNLDETGITTVMRPVKIVSQKGKKQVGQISFAERGALVTFVGIINAVGTSLPPIFVYPRVRNPSEYLSEGSPTGSVALGNKSGWMTSELFPEVLRHIVAHTCCSIENKICLLLDNHNSHISVQGIRYCRSNGIIVLLSFPPHTTHRLQPLDVGIYAPFKAHLATAFNDWMLSHPGQAITIRNISFLANKAYQNAFSLKNITNAFKKTGIWPLDREIFNEIDFLASSVTDRPFYMDEQDNQSSNPEHVSNLEEHDAKPNEQQSLEFQNVSNVCEPSTSGLGCGSKNPTLPTLEELFPYPKANIKTQEVEEENLNAPFIFIIYIRENLELEKMRKQRVTKKKEVIKDLFREDNSMHQPSKMKKVLVNRSSSDSDVSLDDVNSLSSDDLEDFETTSNAEIELEDFVLVKFPTKISVIHYIGRVQEINPPSYTIKFMRRKGSYQTFTFPDVEDIGEVDNSDIVAKLHTPSQTGTVRTASLFSFSYNFDNLIVK